jgi:alpha-ribazole phosphatase
MRQGGTTEICLIRHAPTAEPGRLAGRRDVGALLPGPGALAALRGAVGAIDALLASPAQRCRATAAALWPAITPETDPRLWEQDFGAWEGLATADLPDLGPLPAAALARHRPPGGESFADLCARLAPALPEIAARGGRVALVAHAGTVRGALAHALGTIEGALVFEIGTLSLTRLRALPGGHWSVVEVNRRPAAEAEALGGNGGQA